MTSFGDFMIGAIAEKDAEIARLTECLKKANSQTEEFERRYYLEKDKVDDAEEQLRRARGLLDLALQYVAQHSDIRGGCADRIRAFLAGEVTE